MPDERSLCVICAWRQSCVKKFSMDGATSTRCLDFTKDLTLGASETNEEASDRSERADTDTGDD